MAGIMYGTGWRNRRDKIILTHDEVRAVHKYNYKATDLVLEKHPELKKILTTHAKRDMFGKLLIEKGGGKNRSKLKDWGVTGVTDLGDIVKTMAQEKKITPKEARTIARTLTGATGARQRELLNSLSSDKIFQSHTEEKQVPNEKPTRTIEVKAPLSTLKKPAAETSALITASAATAAAFHAMKPPISGSVVHGKPHQFLAGVRYSAQGEPSQEITGGGVAGPISGPAVHGGHHPSIMKPDRPPMSKTMPANGSGLSHGGYEHQDRPSSQSTLHGNIVRPGIVGNSSFPKATGTAGLRGNVSPVSRLLG
ncbi:MAG: hypothetical protein HGB37_05035 [Candidatus Moranbacteria bacterium]|nr:hypothetical protein [Candidatus Moranbacteria bacterium]